MANYTINDVAHIIDPNQTGTVIYLVERYLNEDIIPAYDPCSSCEPNHARKLIGAIQLAEAQGTWPPKVTDYTVGTPTEEEVSELAKDAAKKIPAPKGKK